MPMRPTSVVLLYPCRETNPTRAAFRLSRGVGSNRRHLGRTLQMSQFTRPLPTDGAMRRTVVRQASNRVEGDHRPRYELVRAMIDCQQNTSRLASLGGREIPRRAFLRQLRDAVGEPSISWRFDKSVLADLLSSESISSIL